MIIIIIIIIIMDRLDICRGRKDGRKEFLGNTVQVVEWEGGGW
jgi:hypothetical protein